MTLIRLSGPIRNTLRTVNGIPAASFSWWSNIPNFTAMSLHVATHSRQSNAVANNTIQLRIGSAYRVGSAMIGYDTTTPLYAVMSSNHLRWLSTSSQLRAITFTLCSSQNGIS